MKYGLLLILCLLCRSLWGGQVYDLGEGLSATDSQIQELARRLPRTTTETRYYHWTQLQTALRWSLNGRIDSGEVDFYNRASGSKQVYGPGIYMAASATSSSSFGKAAAVFVMPVGTLLFDQRIVSEVFGHRNLTDLQLSQLGKLLPFVRNVTSDWWITHHPRNVSKVVFGGVHGASAKWNEMTTVEILEELRQAARNDGEAKHLEALLTLSYYMDGISFYRALKVNPGNPWREFEPQNFEQYLKARRGLLEKALKGNLGMSQDGRFGPASTTTDAWAEKQLREVLPLVFESVSGKSDPGRNYFRDEGIRAGGNSEGQTFKATAAQVEVMKKNPYIEIEVTPHPSGNGFLVAYYYPDVFHYKKLKDKLSPELYRELETLDPARVWKNTQLRRQYNQRIVTDLLKNLFKSTHGRPVSFQGESVQFLMDLVSIHPFKDFNGRVTRLYYDLAHAEAKVFEIPYSFLADLDLMTDITEYQKILKLGAQGHKEMMAAMLEELMKARAEKRAPNYRDLPALDNLWKALQPMGIPQQTTLSAAQLELIKKRRFHELFELLRHPSEINIGTFCKRVFN
ncbi:MAG: hypothetical protein A2X86_01640 [Bdellovibrionales bacterium GWA2_49_15]|nr:MAG: hypothetical protein A2X86_01640 [Bdellovibrionales bacterium GWA2_49_15]